MTLRLYDSAWALLRDVSEPQQVHKDPKNPSIFHVGDYRYDIDGRPYVATEAVPDIVEVLSLSAARERGLSTQYANVTSGYRE